MPTTTEEETTTIEKPTKTPTTTLDKSTSTRTTTTDDDEPTTTIERPSKTPATIESEEPTASPTTPPNESNSETTEEPTTFSSTVTTTTEVITNTETTATTASTTTTTAGNGNNDNKATNTFKPTSTYKYQTLSWLSESFSISIPTTDATAKTTSNTVTTTTTTTTAPATTSPSNNNIPEYIAPNVDAIIPDTSSVVYMKFKYLSYPDMVQDAVLTAQFVQSLPIMLSKSLSITADDVIVVTISSASGSDSKKKKRSVLEKREEATGVVVSIAIPEHQVAELEYLINETNSSLYSTSNGQLATMIDPAYPIYGNAVNSSGNTGTSNIADPNDSNSDNEVITDNQNSKHDSSSSNTSANGGLSKASLIGICVSIGVVVYAAATVGAIVVYRKRRAAKEQKAMAEHQVFAQSISEPIMQENSLGWSSQNQGRYNNHYLHTYHHNNTNQW
ncbi:MAG: hypothetical protein EXX96DRAFT_570273 [Benjaminiella poitrasii]|nr:MAG: hypothetical protein EXX96DRAFT_570273 [Benjaminiella poitrasii]